MLGSVLVVQQIGMRILESHTLKLTASQLSRLYHCLPNHPLNSGPVTSTVGQLLRQFHHSTRLSALRCFRVRDTHQHFGSSSRSLHRLKPLRPVKPLLVRWSSAGITPAPGPNAVSVDDLLSQAHIKSLAETLSCSTAEMKALVRSHAFLIHMELELVESKVQLLLSFGLPASFVKQHVRVLYQASLKVLDERMSLIKHSGLLHSPHLEVDKLAHLLECNGSEFPKSFRNRCDQRDALEGCRDQLAYLQLRLGCSEKTARSMLGSYPLERHVSNVKLKTLLDFLLTEVETTPEFVITSRKLLTFSVHRLRRRWLVMQRAGVTSEAQMVYVWCMSQREFEEQYKEHLTSSSSSSSSTLA